VSVSAGAFEETASDDAEGVQTANDDEDANVNGLDD
jgi:hypothetical protein